MNRFLPQLLIALVLLIPRSMARQISQSDFSGEWKSGALSGVMAGKTKDCTSMAIVERTLQLERVPGKAGKMRGEWARMISYIWISSNRGTCRWDGVSTFDPTITAATFYSIDGTLEPTTGKLIIDGTYEKCNGNGCAAWSLDEVKKPFHTELVYTGGGIVDSDPSAKGQIKFIRTSEASERTDAARLAAGHVLSFVDKGDYDSFFKETWDYNSMTSDMQKKIRDGFDSVRSSQGELVSRVPVREIYAESLINGQTLGDYVCVISDVKSSKNFTAREVVMMGLQNGSWKVLWFNYLS